MEVQGPLLIVFPLLTVTYQVPGTVCFSSHSRLTLIEKRKLRLTHTFNKTLSLIDKSMHLEAFGFLFPCLSVSKMII